MPRTPMVLEEFELPFRRAKVKNCDAMELVNSDRSRKKGNSETDDRRSKECQGSTFHATKAEEMARMNQAKLRESGNETGETILS